MNLATIDGQAIKKNHYRDSLYEDQNRSHKRCTKTLLLTVPQGNKLPNHLHSQNAATKHSHSQHQMQINSLLIK